MENQEQVSYQVCAILGCIPFAAISGQHKAFDHHLNPKKLRSETSTAPVWSLLPAKNNPSEYAGQLTFSLIFYERTEDNAHGRINYIPNH